MAKTPHSYAKRQREIEKKRKADEKRARKLNKGKPSVEEGEVADAPPAEDGEVAAVPSVEDEAGVVVPGDEQSPN